MKKITDRQRVLASAKYHNFTARRRDGEWRICPKGESEAVAYYTSDDMDAIHTMGVWSAIDYSSRNAQCQHIVDFYNTWPHAAK